MKLVIKNSEWLRGTENPRQVFRSGDKFCAMGCLAHQEAGLITNSQIGDYVGLKYWDTCQRVETVNDDLYTTDAEKIEALRLIFAAHGVEIEYLEDL